MAARLWELLRVQHLNAISSADQENEVSSSTQSHTQDINENEISNNNFSNATLTFPRPTSLEMILQLHDEDFRSYFKLSKETALRLVIQVLGYDLVARLSVDTHTKILCDFLITYHYFSTGDYSFTLAPEHVRTCRILDTFTKPTLTMKGIIVNMSKLILRQKHCLSFPKSEVKQLRLLEAFQCKFNILHTLGCIDCLHVSIVRPNKEPLKYINMHGYESLNVEAICDSNLKFMSVRIFPGSSRDYHSFSTSPIRSNLHQTLLRNRFALQSINWLLCDDAYPVDTFLLPPYQQQEQNYELAFNLLHMKVFDATIKKALSTIRTTFKCLLNHQPIDFNPEISEMIVRAVFTMYNFLLERNEIDFEADAFEVDDMEENFSNLNISDVTNCTLGEEARKHYARKLAESISKSENRLVF